MPLATGVKTPVPWVEYTASGMDGYGAVLDANNKYAYLPISNQMIKINIQQGCSGLGIPAVFPLTHGVDIGDW